MRTLAILILSLLTLLSAPALGADFDKGTSNQTKLVMRSEKRGDYATAFNGNSGRLKKAEQGHAKAELQHNLGLMYHNG